MTFGRALLVRRLTAPALDMETRYEIAVHALTGLRRGYSFEAVPRLAWLAMRRRVWEPDWRPEVAATTICSTLVRNAYSAAAVVDLLQGVTGVAWPADLSHAAALVDVPIGWVRVTNGAGS